MPFTSFSPRLAFILILIQFTRASSFSPLRRLHFSCLFVSHFYPFLLFLRGDNDDGDEDDNDREDDNYDDDGENGNVDDDDDINDDNDDDNHNDE